MAWAGFGVHFSAPGVLQLFILNNHFFCFQCFSADSVSGAAPWDCIPLWQYFPSGEWIGEPWEKPGTCLLSHPPLWRLKTDKKFSFLWGLCGHRSSKLAERNRSWEFPGWKCEILSSRQQANPCSYFECSLNCFMSSAVLTSASVNFYVYCCITSLTPR